MSVVSDAVRVDSSIELIRVHIDGEWTAQEMSSSCHAIDDLYNLGRATRLSDIELTTLISPFFNYDPVFHLGFGSISGMDLLSKVSERLATRAASQASAFKSVHPLDVPLRVRRIQYGSEGFKDFVGLGEVVGHLKDLLIKLIEIGTSRRFRWEELAQAKVATVRAQEELRTLEVENHLRMVHALNEYMALLKKAGYSRAELKALFRASEDRCDLFASLVAQGKITALSIPDEV